MACDELLSCGESDGECKRAKRISYFCFVDRGRYVLSITLLRARGWRVLYLCGDPCMHALSPTKYGGALPFCDFKTWLLPAEANTVCI